MPRPTGVWAFVQIFHSAVNARQWALTLWYRSISAFPSNWDGNAFAQAIFTSVTTSAYLGFLSEKVTVQGADALVNNGTFSIGFTYSPTSTTAGTGTNGLLPESVGAVVQRISDAVTRPHPRGGQAGRGRIFLLGLDNGLVDGNELENSLRSSIQTWSAVLKNPLTDQTMAWDPVVFTKSTGAVHTVASTNVDTLLGSARRTRERF